MAEIESSSAAINPISPFYGNLFQRIQFHGIVINRIQNEIIPYDACCPSLQTKLPSRLCSICKQYIPTSIRLRNHYTIHQQHTSNNVDYMNNKEEDIVDDHDLNDPYDMPITTTQNGVYLFKDMIEWLKSDFEDDPIIVDTKTKSTAATAAAMIRKDKQMAAAAAAATSTTTTTMTTTTMNQTITEEEEITTINETEYVNDSQTIGGSVLNALQQLAMMDDGDSSSGTGPSWDDIEDLIDNI